MRRPMRLACAAGLLSLSPLLACGTASPPRTRPAAPDDWPTEGWRSSTPEAQGVDSDQLAEALLSVRAQQLHLHSLLLVRHGRVIADAVLDPWPGQSVHDVASVTKSVTATLVGMAVHDGLLDVHRPVLDYFPELRIADPDGSRRQLRVEHLVDMPSGLECGRRPGEVELLAMMASPDWTRFTLELPLASRPGAGFAYCSPNFHLLSALLTRVTGESELAYARRRLFGPLGIREVAWPSGPDGLTVGWGDLRLLPRDLAKLGFLYLHGGRWEGRALLGRDWVEASGRPRVATGRPEAYSLGWWVSTGELRGLYSARGRGGQALFVWPERDLLLILTGSGYDLDLFGPRIVAALRSDRPLPENPAAQRRLAQVIAELARPPAGAEGPPAALPDAARRISGRTWRLEENPLGLHTLSLTFGDGATAAGTIEARGQALAFELGLDGSWRRSPGGRLGLPVAGRGRWIGPTQLAFELDELANVNRWELALAVAEEEIVLHVSEHTGMPGGEPLRLRGTPAR